MSNYSGLEGYRSDQDEKEKHRDFRVARLKADGFLNSIGDRSLPIIGRKDTNTGLPRQHHPQKREQRVDITKDLSDEDYPQLKKQRMLSHQRFEVSFISPSAAQHLGAAAKASSVALSEPYSSVPVPQQLVKLGVTEKKLCRTPPYDTSILGLFEDRPNVWVNQIARRCALDMWNQVDDTAPEY